MKAASGVSHVVGAAAQAFHRWKQWQDSACIQALSFTPDTKVATAKGSQAIGTLHVGEKVWAYNAKTHNMELQPILHVWINHDNDLVDLTVRYHVPAHTGKLEQKTSEVIHTTAKHPFLIAGKGFVTVANIHVGMRLVSSNGSLGIIQTWKAIPGIKAMYNLTIAQDHTYTVGAGQWIVHNDNCAYLAGLIIKRSLIGKSRSLFIQQHDEVQRYNFRIFKEGKCM